MRAKHRCPLHECGADPQMLGFCPWLYFTETVTQPFLRERNIDLHQCSECGFQFFNPKLAGSAEFYEQLRHFRVYMPTPQTDPKTNAMYNLPSSTVTAKSWIWVHAVPGFCPGCCQTRRIGNLRYRVEPNGRGRRLKTGAYDISGTSGKNGPGLGRQIRPHLPQPIAGACPGSVRIGQAKHPLPFPARRDCHSRAGRRRHPAFQPMVAGKLAAPSSFEMEGKRLPPPC